MIPTSLGILWKPVPEWFAADTRSVLNGNLTHAGVNVANGHPWIDSPTFDRLAGERFGS